MLPEPCQIERKPSSESVSWCWDRHDHKLIAFCLTAALDPFALADRQNIARLFSPLSKQLQLQHYSGKPVVEHTIYERPLMAQRADEVNC